jgi:hypothetical protein
MKVETTKATDKVIDEVGVLKVDKIALYILETESIAYKKKLEAKQHALEELTRYMNRFIKVDAKLAFKTDIKQYFISEFESIYKKDFPSYLKTEKLMDLLEVSIVLLDTLIDKYSNLSIENFDATTRTAPEPDFTVYAHTPEQIERYYETIGIVNHLNHLIKHVTQGLNPRYGLCSLVKVVGYDERKHCFNLNYYYVIHGKYYR